MADRADYLARTLVSRLDRLRTTYTEDGRGAPDRRTRIETIEKVLAIELGVTDGATLSLIEAAAPSFPPFAPASSRDLAEFAEFLRRRLGAQLAAT